MKVFENYSVDTVLHHYEQGARDEETCFLYRKIQQYKIQMESQITFFYDRYQKDHPEGSVKDFMLWVETNVPDPIKWCLRNRLKGLPYDVLKRNANRYKTISQIGIEVLTRSKTEPKNYLKQWSVQAQRMSELKCPVFETHAHYNLEDFGCSRDELLLWMHEAGVEKCIIPSIEAYKDERSINQETIRTFTDYEWIYYAFASHPKYLWKDKRWDEKRWEEFEKLLEHPKCIAVGETGFDYSYPTFNTEHQRLQEEFFIRFIDIANRHELPVILHLRSGYNREKTDSIPDVNEDAIRILTTHPIKHGAVFHCFNGDSNTMKKYQSCGVEYFGIGGFILNGIKQLEDAVQEMPMEAIILETDAPYINTMPGITGPNTSFTLLAAAEKISKIKKISVQEVLKTAYKNAERIFNCITER